MELKRKLQTLCNQLKKYEAERDKLEVIPELEDEGKDLISKERRP